MDSKCYVVLLGFALPIMFCSTDLSAGVAANRKWSNEMSGHAVACFAAVSSSANPEICAAIAKDHLSFFDAQGKRKESIYARRGMKMEAYHSKNYRAFGIFELPQEIISEDISGAKFTFYSAGGNALWEQSGMEFSALSDDGKTAVRCDAFTAEGRGKIQFYDSRGLIATQEVPGESDLLTDTRAKFSGDGKSCVAMTVMPPVLYFFNGANWTAKWTKKFNFGQLNFVEPSRSAQYLVAFAFDFEKQSGRIFGIDGSGNVLWYKDDMGGLGEATFSPDEKFALITNPTKKEFSLIDSLTGHEYWRQTYVWEQDPELAKSAEINSIIVSEDAKFIAISKKLSTYNPSGGRKDQTGKDREMRVFSRDGSLQLSLQEKSDSEIQIVGSSLFVSSEGNASEFLLNP